MYKAMSVGPDIWWVGVNDRETHLFESLWLLPQGMAYNAYVVGGEKTAAIDTVKGPWFDDYANSVKEALDGLGKKTLDYLVINHMEPDHAGMVGELKRAWPDLKLIGNAKTLPLLKGYHNLGEMIQVKDGETLDLGGRVLTFYTIPMVHWPESMVTYDAAAKTLFSNDAFGGYGAHEGGLFDDEKNRARWENEMLRYYATIVARYSGMVQTALKKLGGLDIRAIYPAHGTLFRKDVGQVVELYDRWSKQETDPGLVVAYGTMYGNTRRMAEAVCHGASEAGLKDIVLHDASRSETSVVLRDIWRRKGLALLGCTYNTTLFPTLDGLCSKLLNRMPKNRVLGLAGSYSWSKGALDALRAFADAVKLEKIGPEVEVFTSPTDADLKQCALLGQNLAQAIQK